MIKSNILLYSLCCAEACTKLTRPISALLCPGNTAPFKEMLQRWRAVGNIVSDLTGPHRVVNGLTSSGSNPARKYKPDPGPNPKTNLKPKSCSKNPKVKLGLKNLAMLQGYFDYIFVHLRQKVRLRPEIFVNFRPEPNPKSPARLTTLGPRFELQTFAPGTNALPLDQLAGLYHDFTANTLQTFVMYSK